MKLSTKGRYAVTAMFDVAMHDDGSPVALSDIAQRQSISLSYLEQLFGRLRRGGLVASTRGPGGGYRLARAAEDIAIADIIGAVDETLDATRCKGNADCHNHQRCLTHELWTDLSSQINSFLSEISLADAINKKHETNASLTQAQQRVVFQSDINI